MRSVCQDKHLAKLRCIGINKGQDNSEGLSCPLLILVAGVGFEGDGGQAGFYFFLEIATIIKPSMTIATAGATVSPVAPDRNSHTANAMQMSPTISLSFLT